MMKRLAACVLFLSIILGMVTLPKHPRSLMGSIGQVVTPVTLRAQSGYAPVDLCENVLNQLAQVQGQGVWVYVYAFYWVNTFMYGWDVYRIEFAVVYPANDWAPSSVDCITSW